jgi:hypothetical protein
MNDHLIILQRALRASSPSLSDQRSTRYAEFILRMAAWEANLSASVLEGTIRGIFPTWPAYPLEETASSMPQHAEIYLGHNSQGELSFTVRFRKDLDMYATSSTESSSKAVSAAAKTAAEGMPADVALEVVYYREFVLTDAVIDTFGQASFVSSTAIGAGKGAQQFVPPPPPPKRNKASGAGGTESEDIRVYVLVTHRLATTQNATEATAAAAAAVEAGDEVSAMADSAAEAEDENFSEAWVAKSFQQDRNVSFCSELYGWGHDAHHSLGLGEIAGAGKRAGAGADKKAIENANPEGEDAEQDRVHGPRRIPLDRIISMERVRSVACSGNHTLLLTCMGSVFACGENSEGALGTGDLVSRYSFSAISFSFQRIVF